MRFDLEDLSLRGGERHESAHSLEFAPITLGGTPYQVLLADGVNIAVDRVAGGFLVNVRTKARVYGPCARCLNEVALVVQAEEQEFVPTAGGHWEDSDLSPFVDGLVVDIEGIAREAVILALPEQVLCSTECQGLCAQCGHDLNRGPCGCTALEISQPMG